MGIGQRRRGREAKKEKRDRTIRAAAGLLLRSALMASIVAASAQAGPVPTKAPEARSEPKVERDWTAADYKAVRDRDEARQRAWDQKMKDATRSICIGC
jgi:hypothetical protein